MDSRTTLVLLCLAYVLGAVLCDGDDDHNLFGSIRNCAPDSDLAELTGVSVLGFRKNDTVCTLRRDKHTTISIDFINKKREWRVTSKVHGVIAGLSMPFDLKHPDACKDTGLVCPLAPGPQTYTYSIFVDKNKPKLKHVDVKWELLNEFNKPIVCVLIPAKIR
ncbi:ecdysteroid-regulated 16 kDa protein-like [Frankliniella occidentalis]|uniref:Ecdysteroid-regulated 16 kDa protein-like n=1 Tax=Frankliniella occidentalis TaxID=133901 RepID=A0A6J1SPD8_FRAOC|nr:ecdysteroid-regulated 16 kDa protein-like [Frankliniella occidentalis]